MSAPLGPVLESALKEDTQGGKLYVCKGRVVTPCFFCCMSGRDAGGLPTWDIGVAKDPVAVLIVNPTTQLVANNVNSDYSHSWSPFSTINSWSIDWGDGQVSAGAWPGAGNINHPLGGYTLEGTYTITLTVTDLLGATGTDSQQVHIVSADFEAFAGCGASGVWHTSDGSNWQDVSTDTLDGIEVYDLKVNPFSVDLDDRELWAATANGLYKTVDSGGSWKPITLPDPDGGTDYPVAASIVCSPVDALEVYVLAYRTVPTSQVWLYRTVDGGTTWTHLLISTSFTTETTFTGSVASLGDFAIFGGDLYASAHSAVDGFQKRHDGVWGTEPSGGHGVGGMEIHGGYLYAVVWPLAAASKLWRWNGSSWATVNTHKMTNCLQTISDGTLLAAEAAVIATTSYFLKYVNNSLWARIATKIGVWPWPDIYSVAGTYYNDTFVTLEGGDEPAGVYYLCRDVGDGNFPIERYHQAFSPTAITCYPQYKGVNYIFEGPPGGPTKFYRRVGTSWFAVNSDIATGVRTLYVREIDGKEELYAVASDGLYYYYSGQWLQIIDSSGIAGFTPYKAIWYDDAWFLLNKNKVVRVGSTAAVGIPTMGKTHLISMSADGWFVYVAALDSASNPVVFRVPYNLGGHTTVYEPGAGSWGGVVCDPTRAETVWLFGDFGANVKLLTSDDWGDTLTDLTDAGWQGANEIVRPALPSLYDPADVIVIHHDPVAPTTTAYQTKDGGTTWTSRGTAPFQPQCGERDWYDPEHLLIGKIGPAPTGANHLSWSPNEGAGWHERSGGFSGDSPVVSIQVVG